MSNQVLNRILISAIAVLSVLVVTLTTLIIKEGKPIEYDKVYKAQEESEEDEVVQPVNEPQTQEEAVEEKKMVMVTTRVNIRDRDSEDGRVLDTVEEGAVYPFVEVLGSGWTHILYDEQDAYISSKYVKLVSADQVNGAENAEETE